MASTEPKQARIAFKCQLCKHGWIATATLVYHHANRSGYWVLRNDPIVHMCEALGARVWKEAEYNVKQNWKFNEVAIASYILQNGLVRWDLVKGFVNPEVKCDARCLNAHGKSCECACGGEHHGESTAA